MTATGNNILLIGDLCLDLFLHIPTYPPEGGDGTAEQFYQQTGGSAANTAIVLAHLGDRPRLLTHCGQDAWAEEVLPVLHNAGVRTDLILQREAPTGLTVAVVSQGGERTMFTHRGANALLSPAEVQAEYFDGLELLHVSGYALLSTPEAEAVAKAVQLAAARDIRVSLDIGVEPAHRIGARLHKLFPQLSLLVLGEPEALALSGQATLSDAVETLLQRGVQTLGLKLGKNGCRIITRQEEAVVPGLEVQVVDTTGAGDAFSAGLIHGLTSGWPLAASALLANALGAMSATRWGAGAALPDRAELARFLSRQTTDYAGLLDLLASR